MKKLCLVALLFLCACSNTTTPKDNVPKKEVVKEKTENNTITLKPNEGEVKSIAMKDAFKMMDEKQTFVILVSQTYCNACLSFFMESDEYTKEIGLNLWDIVLDDEETNEDENLTLVNDRFEHFSATPSIYYIKDGKVIDSLCSDKTEVNLKNYKKFLQKNKIID